MTEHLDNYFRNAEILCYHRVVKNDIPLNLLPDDGLAISVRNFEKHIIWFKNKFQLIDLKSNELTNKPISRKSLLITFDDGYNDIVNVVVPIIEKHNVPIVVFISTGQIANKSEFCWWIDLWKNLLGNNSLSLNIKGQIQHFNIESFSQKMKCYNFLSGILINWKRTDQIDFFVFNRLKMNYSKDFLSCEEIKTLSKHPLVTVGFHSHRHLNYRTESLEVIEDDIEKMNNFFATNMLYPPYRLFAFCYGISSDFFLKSSLVKRFDYTFALGYRALNPKLNYPCTSRINVHGSNTPFILNMKINSFKIVKKVFKIIQHES